MRCRLRQKSSTFSFLHPITKLFIISLLHRLCMVRESENRIAAWKKTKEESDLCNRYRLRANSTRLYAVMKSGHMKMIWSLWDMSSIAWRVPGGASLKPSLRVATRLGFVKRAGTISESFFSKVSKNLSSWRNKIPQSPLQQTSSSLSLSLSLLYVSLFPLCLIWPWIPYDRLRLMK